MQISPMCASYTQVAAYLSTGFSFADIGAAVADAIPGSVCFDAGKIMIYPLPVVKR
jgi:hypothetical protein